MTSVRSKERLRTSGIACRLLRPIGLLSVMVMCTGCEPTPTTTEKMPLPTVEVAAHTLETDGQIREVRVEGPVEALDLTVDGISIFEPVAIDPGLSGYEKARTLFEFVARNIPSWNVQRQVDRSQVLYGTGYGMCIDQAKLLTTLWRLHGLPGRVVASADHSAAEVFVDGRWFFFDPQHGLDLSDVFQTPTSHGDLQGSEVEWPFAFDRFGYQTAWLQRTYSGMNPLPVDPGHHPLRSPTLGLADHQTLTIRPRSTLSESILPLSPVPPSVFRSDLIAGCEVTIDHVFRGETGPVCFDTGLPLIDLRLDSDIHGDLVWHRSYSQWRRRDENQTSTISVTDLRQRTLGWSQRLCFEGPEGAVLSLTYPLAGWIENRLFGAPAGSRVALLAIRPCRADLLSGDRNPSVRLETVRRTSVSAPGGNSLIVLELAWSNLDRPVPIEVVVEELASRLPLSRMRELAALRVTLPGSPDSPAGKTTVTVAWEEPARMTNRGGRHGRERYLLVRARGPGLDAGANHALVVSEFTPGQDRTSETASRP